jgi:hypothetical protein
MTLLELIVGLTVTGVTVSAGYGAFTSMVDHRARAAERIEGTARAAEGRRALAEWLEHGRLVVDQDGPLFRGLDGVYQGLPDDDLSFLTSGGPGGSREVIVRLHIDRDSLTPERGLTAELSGWRNPHSELVQVEPRAAGLDFRYSTRVLGETEWLPSWISSTVLPSAVELRILPEPDDTLPALLRLPIVVPLGSGR